MAKKPPGQVPNRTAEGGGAGQTAELEDLERFCEGVALPEIELEDWQKIHQRLDLQIPVTVSVLESQAPGFKSVTYIRVVKLVDHEMKIKKSKLKVSQTITWESPLREEQEFLFPGEGDHDNGHFGDARIIVKIKNL
jgi:hypothetical protein